MTVKANKIFRSLVAIIICISMLLLPIPMEKLGINIGNGIVRADVTEAQIAAALSLLDDYGLIVAEDLNGGYGCNIKGPIAVGGDYNVLQAEYSKNSQSSYFTPRDFDIVVGGEFLNDSGVGLTSLGEFYLIATKPDSNFRCAYTNNNATYNLVAGTTAGGFDYLAYDSYGTTENPLPVDFEGLNEAFSAWTEIIDSYCADTTNSDITQIADSDKLYIETDSEGISYFNYNSTLSADSALYITVPNANSKLVINLSGSGNVSFQKYYIKFADSDSEYIDINPGETMLDPSDSNRTQDQIDHAAWANTSIVFSCNGGPTINNVLAGALIAPNSDVASQNFNGSWYVKSFSALYSTFNVYSDGLASFNWPNWIPTSTPAVVPKADIEVTLVDDSDPVVDITSLCETDPDTYFVLVDSEGTEVKKATYENGKVVFKGVPVDEDEYAVVQFGYPKDGNDTPYVTVDGGVTSINVEVTDKDTYVVTGGYGEADNKVIFQNRLAKYVDVSFKVVDGDNTTKTLENAVIDVNDGTNDIASFTTGTDGIGVDTNSSSVVRIYEKTEYTATESTVPTDYVANPDSFVITVDNEGDLIINGESIDVPSSMSYSLLIKNVKPRSFDVIVSTVDENDEPISGIDVTITNKDDSTITYTLTTDGTGKVVFEDIPEGDYEIEQDEDDIPKNHEADSVNPKELTIPHDYDDSTVTKFVNSTTPVVVNIKVEGSDGTLLENVPVRVVIDGITDPIIETTNSSGIASFELKEGYSYTITDSLSGMTYAASYKATADEAPVTGSVAVGSDTINLTLTHQKLATNDIVAVTKVGDTPTGGFEVTLYDSTGTTVIAGPEETGVDGKYTFEDMTEGTYIVKVTDKDGYTLQSERSVTVSYDSTTSSFNTATFTFAELEGSISGKVTDDATTPNPMEGVTVTLYDSLGNQVGSSVTTNSDGEYIFTDVVIGEYTVKVSDYTDTNSIVWTATSTNPKDAEVSSSTTDVTDVNFVMAKKTVTMTVSVVDGNDSALTESVEVTVTDGNGYTEKVTTSTGSATFTVPVGVTYTVSDTTPDGYKPSTSQTVPVASDATSASATLKHAKINTVTITCYVKDDNGTRLSGAQLTLTNTETSEVFGGQTFTTDATGTIVFENVPEGKYTLVEVQPTGYEDDAQPTRNLTIYPSSFNFQQTFNNAKILGSVSGIVKDDSGNPISGVTITLLDKDKNPITGFTTTTDTNGEYEFEDLGLATYFVQETTPTGYEDATVNPVEVTLTATSKTGTANFTNEYILKEVPLTITVYDKDKTPNVGIAGVSVTVTDVSDPTNTYTGTTLADGTVVIDVLEGSTYRITDVAPSGYGTSDPAYDDVTIDIGDLSASGALYHSAVPTATLVVEINNDSTYDTSALTGTEVRYGGSVNPTIGTKVTLADVSGVATGTINLEPGTYYFEEIAAQTGFESTDGDFYYQVVVSDLGVATITPYKDKVAGTPLTSNVMSFNNKEILGTITVEVKDSTATAVKDVEITLCDENGDPITSISPITTGTDGKATFSDLPLGTYKVLETVPSGYKDPSENPVVVTLTASNTNGTATFTNAKINVVDVEVTVEDDQGTPISGVSVVITDTVTKETYTTTSTTDANGMVTIENVPEGKYEVTEVSTPAGYNDAEPEDLEITSTTTKGEVTLTNARITGKVTVNVINTTSGDITVLTGTTIIYSTSNSFTNPTTVTLTNGTTAATADINLLPGTYFFKLSAPQDGYLQDYTYVLYYQAEVDANGTVTIYERFDESGYLYTRSQKIDGNVMNFYCSTETGTVSGTVTSDGTAPIANVTIYLRDEKGNNVKTTTTAADGTYSFANVRKGTYYVVEKVPDKYHDPVSNNVETILTSDKLTASVNFINAPITVSGNVTGTDSTPLEGVTVTLINSYGTPVGTATTDKDGNYTIEGVSNGTYTVTISNSDGYLPTDSKSATVSSKKDVTDLDFAPVPNKLSGTVTGTDVNGDPADLDGLVVTITDSKGNTRTTTVTNGAYEFTKVSNETYTVSVEAKDTYEAFDDQTGIVVANDNKTANFTTTPVSVSGTLVDENDQPIAGQTITITDANGSHNVTTKTDGTYSFAGVANGEITIAVSNVDGYVPFTNLTPTVAGKSLTGQNFKAVPSTISGTVTGTDASGNPADLDGLKVTIEDSQGHTQTTTVENGKYEFTKVPNETYTVSVEQKDTYVAFDDQTGIVVANDNKTANFTTAPLTVSGTLVDENDQPIAGQTITLTDKNGTYNVTTESDGTYSFTGVANGDISITSTVPDGYNYTGKINASVAGTSLKNMNFATKPTVVSGTAMDEDGVTPLPNQTVTVTDKNGKTYTATTGTDGSYSVSGVVDGAITIAITTPEGYNTISNLTNTVAGKDLPNQNFKGHKTVVSGTAMDEDGVTPLVGETVTVTDKNGTTYTATTGNDGSYSVSGVVDGDITIAITTPNGYDTISNLTNTVAGKDLTNQNFKGVPTEVSGNVTDTNGNPLENVEVQLVDKNDPTNVIGPVKTDSDGNFITTKVPNGDYDVEVITPDGYKPVVPEEISVKNDSHKGLTFTPAPTEVTGNVTDTDGNPLENVEVQLVDKNDPTNVIGPVKTDSDGDFITTNVPNGDYDVVVITPDGYKPVDPQGITVKNDDHGPLTFTPDASRVSGNVTDTDDIPLDGVEIQLVDPNDPTNVIDTTTTDSNGDYEFKNVPNGDYKVVVVTPDGYKPVDPKDITVKNNDHLKTDFTPDATRVTGTVTDDEGTGLDGVTVKIVDPNDPTKVIDTTTTGTDGNYEFKKVPNGDYKVVVDTPAGHQPATPVPVKVKNDDNKNINFTSNIIEDVYVHITDENGAPIPGVTVTLTDVNNPGNPISGTTNSDGKVVFPDLRVGDYEITETRPDGYHSDSVEKHTVNVSGSGVKFDGSNTPDIDNTLEITNKKIAEDITIELTDDNGNPVPGADITLYDDNGNVVDTKKTDANGKVTFTDVPEGEYTIGEKSPAGYDDDPDCPIKVSVKDDGVHFNDDVNADPDNKYEIDTAKDYYRTEVTVYVHDERKAPLANATIVIANDSAFTDVIGTKITGSNGLAVFEDMAPGTYYVRESVIPTNFTCEEHSFVLVIGEDGIMTVDGKAVANNGIYRYARRDLFITIDITNYLITAGAGAKVVDTNGDPIKNATIVITDPDGNVIGTFKTDDLGRIDIDDLPVGKYTITVTELPNGYSGAPFSRTLEVLSDGKVAVDGVTFDGAVLVTFRFTIEKSDKPGAATSTGEESNKFVPCLGTAFIITALFALVLAGKKRKEEQDA